MMLYNPFHTFAADVLVFVDDNGRIELAHSRSASRDYGPGRPLSRKTLDISG